jgi:DNA-binding beta-propeller fold protein YncE
VDGRLNVWIPNNANGTSTGSVSELGSANTTTGLSPSTGFQKDASFLTSGRALAVDQAGNVWVAGDGTNFITEIVGAGVPIFQPYALGLKLGGRFQSIP